MGVALLLSCSAPAVALPDDANSTLEAAGSGTWGLSEAKLVGEVEVESPPSLRAHAGSCWTQLSHRDNAGHCSSFCNGAGWRKWCYAYGDCKCGSDKCGPRR